MLTDNSTASDSGMGFFFYHLGKILFQNEREVPSSEFKKEKKSFHQCSGTHDPNSCNLCLDLIENKPLKGLNIGHLLACSLDNLED